MNKILDLSPLKKGMVHVWYTDLRYWRTLAATLGKIISPEEHLRAERFLLPELREDYILQRGITRSILSHYLENNPDQITILIGETGKPYLPDSTISYNISHSDNLLACAVTVNTRLGIDVQQIYPISSLEYISQKILSPAEQDLLFAIPQEERLDLFFGIWTAKEAYIKGTAEGFSRSLNDFTICHKSDLATLYQLTGKPVSGWSIQALSIHSDYKAAVAVEGDLIQVESSLYSPEMTLWEGYS